MVKAELLFGALKSARREHNLEAIERFLQPFSVAPFGDPEATSYAEIRAELEREGTPIGANDLVIAATARARGVTLVTNNIREFSRVRGLLSADWTVE